MSDGTGSADKMPGLCGVVGLDVEAHVGKVVVTVEPDNSKAWCPSYRKRAQAQDRVEVHLRDVHCFRRPTRQVGQICRSVTSVAPEYKVGWDTLWSAVTLHGTPLVDDPTG